MELSSPRDALRKPTLDEDPRSRFDDAATKLHGASLSVPTPASAGPEDLDPPDDGPDPDLRPGGRPSPFQAMKELGSKGNLYRF